MKRIKYLLAALLGTVAATFDRLIHPQCIALPNELALMNEHGIETLMIQAGTSPVSGRYLLYKRGAGGQGYCDICTATDFPLGPSSDSPYQDGDFVNVRRLGVRPGFELGIPLAAITVDHLVVPAAAGKVQDITAVVANGTYWVVGRCLKTVAAGAIEVAYAPCVPYAVTVSNNGGTYAFTGAGS
jgi:hypothetical protein